MGTVIQSRNLPGVFSYIAPLEKWQKESRYDKETMDK